MLKSNSAGAPFAQPMGLTYPILLNTQDAVTRVFTDYVPASVVSRCSIVTAERLELLVLRHPWKKGRRIERKMMLIWKNQTPQHWKFMSNSKGTHFLRTCRVSLRSRCTGHSTLLFLMSVVTVASLSFAGYAGYRLSTTTGVFGVSQQATAPQEHQQTEAAVAWVNVHPITQSYVDAKVASLPTSQQTKLLQNMDQFVESLIQEEALFQSALNTNFNSEPALRERVKTLVVNGLIDKHVSSAVKITDEMIQEYYDNNQSTIREEHVGASHIVLEERTACEKLMPLIDSIDTFERLAREQSLDQNTAADGGRIGLLMNHSGGLGFEKQLFDMQVDDMKVFESNMGCHIVRLTDHVVPPLPPLEQVRVRIKDQLERRESASALQMLLRRGIENVDITRK